MDNIINIQDCDDYYVLSRLVQPNKNNPVLLHELLHRIFQIAKKTNEFCCVYANAHPDSELKTQAREKLLATSSTLYDFCKIYCMARCQNDLLDFAYQNIIRLIKDFESASFVYFEVYKDTPPYTYALEKLLEYSKKGSQLYEVVRQNKTKDLRLIDKINDRLIQLGSKKFLGELQQIKNAEAIKNAKTQKPKLVKQINPDTGLFKEKKVEKIAHILMNTEIDENVDVELIKKIRVNPRNFDMLLKYVSENRPKQNHVLKLLSSNLAIVANYNADKLFDIYSLFPHRSEFNQPITNFFTLENTDFEAAYQRVFSNTSKKLQHRLVSTMLLLAKNPEQVLLIYSKINRLNNKRNECVARLYEIAQSFDDWYQVYRYESDVDKLQHIFKNMLLVATKMNEFCFIHNTTKHYPELYEQASYNIMERITGISSMCYAYNHIQSGCRLHVVLEEMIMMQAKTPKITGKILRKVADDSSLHSRIQELHGKLQLSYIQKRNAVAQEDEEDEHLYQILLRYEPINY